MNSDITRLEQENLRLREQLGEITKSKAYKLGLTARLTIREPKRVVRKALKVAKAGPKGFVRRLRTSTDQVTSFQSSSMVLDADYQEWMRWNDPTEKELEAQRKSSLAFKKKPVISIITPVFKPPTDVLEELIQSVLNQTYPYFELCMAEVANHEPSRELIQKYAKLDKRIKLKVVKKNGGISKDSNQCLTLATGDYIALLDHDDLLSPNALFENAKLINEADYDFIYSDKDKITAEGRRYEPLFKPDWSPEIMLNANYLTHFNVFKHSLIKKIGGWNHNTDGAQDWDLFFRLIHESKLVGHVSKVLYHWRVIETSTAHSILTKPYALEGQRNAIASYAGKNNLKILAKHDVHGVLSVDWEPTQRATRILVVEDGTHTLSDRKLASIESRLNARATRISSGDASAFFEAVLPGGKNKDNVLVVHSSIVEDFTKDDLHQLAGWLTVKGVASSTPHIIAPEGAIADMGRILGYRSAFGPIFAGASYMPHVFGYKEWIRNVSTGSPYATLFSAEHLTKELVASALAHHPKTYYDAFWSLSVLMRANGLRAVSTPYVQLYEKNSLTSNEPAPNIAVQTLLAETFPDGDNLFNVNLSPNKSGPRLIDQEECRHFTQSISLNYSKGLVGITEVGALSRPSGIPPEQHRDALILSSSHSYRRAELKASSEALKAQTGSLKSIDKAVWFIPEFKTLYAGLKNIFALADLLAETEATSHTFVFQHGTSREALKTMRSLVGTTFPGLKSAVYITLDPDEGESALPESDIAICTLWTTAYNLLRYNSTKRKCYIIQDWEPAFYPKGTVSSIAEATYTFGFTALAGTPALARMYEKYKAGNVAYVLPSLLDLSSYLSHTRPSRKKGPKRVMFYGRPDSPRNAFELGVNALTGLKRHYGDDVEILVAGSVFDETLYDFDGRGIQLAGKVPYDRLAEFYASFDACLFLMYSEHPGVVPLEMMSSGVPVVVNSHTNAEWDVLYKDGKTCVRALSSATDIEECLVRVLEDTALRNTLISNGEKLARDYTDAYYRNTAEKAIIEVKRKMQ